LIRGNLEDKIFLDVLDFIIAKTNRLQPIYLYASEEVDRLLTDKDIISFINKYSIEIIKGENKEFIANLKEKFKDDYFGGILLIDELEATLYPGAQKKLIEFLNKYSAKYNIKI